jgi:hypothetical protein
MLTGASGREESRSFARTAGNINLPRDSRAGAQQHRRFIDLEVWPCFVAIDDYRHRRGAVVTISHRANMRSGTIKIDADHSASNVVRKDPSI